MRPIRLNLKALSGRQPETHLNALHVGLVDLHLNVDERVSGRGITSDVHVVEERHRVEISLAMDDLVLAEHIARLEAQEAPNVRLRDFAIPLHQDFPDSHEWTRYAFQHHIRAKGIVAG